MQPVLKLKKYNQNKEIEFELRYLRSLTVQQRFRMLFEKSDKMRQLLKKSGHRKTLEVIKRT